MDELSSLIASFISFVCLINWSKIKREACPSLSHTHMHYTQLTKTKRRRLSQNIHTNKQTPKCALLALAHHVLMISQFILLARALAPLPLKPQPPLSPYPIGPVQIEPSNPKSLHNIAVFPHTKRRKRSSGNHSLRPLGQALRVWCKRFLPQHPSGRTGGTGGRDGRNVKKVGPQRGVGKNVIFSTALR